MLLKRCCFLFTAWICYAQCPPCTNQTPNVTIPLPEDSLPYRVTLETADFTLPVGLHSFAFAVYKGDILFITGRTNGLHNVNNTDPNSNSFPVTNQNTVIYVFNPETQETYSRSIFDPSSHLSQSQIDLLSVTNALFYQTKDKKTLYLVGGYGFDTFSQVMKTQPALTAIDIPHLIQWVKDPTHAKSAAACIRSAFHPLLQLTGGVMWQSNEHQPYLLAFGQNFSGNYVETSNGSYSYQIRPIQILDNGKKVSVHAYDPPEPRPAYRRRDLNVVPIVKKQGKGLEMGYTALSGVFTPAFNNDNPGAWTVPIEINPDGSSQMLDPNDPNTLAQAMNNYSCANAGLYSQKNNRMYTLLFGGISGAIISDGSNCNTDPNPQNNCCTAWVPAPGNTFTVCCNLPFSNDITTIEIDPEGVYRQYLMSEKYPIIPVIPITCPGYTPPPNTQFWFGANAAFIPNGELPTYPNGVIALDKLKKPTFIGYIVGGIASTVTDTNCTTDTQASNYVFKVTITPISR
jgi:hypothetical protein